MIELREQVRSIGTYAFGYSGLTSINFPENLKSIGENAFSFTNLKSVYIPKSVSNIVLGAFSPCYKLEAFHVSVENQDYMSIEGVLFNHNGTILYAYNMHIRVVKKE